MSKKCVVLGLLVGLLLFTHICCGLGVWFASDLQYPEEKIKRGIDVNDTWFLFEVNLPLGRLELV